MERPSSPASSGVPARAGMYARRAAAARRRALLTVILLLLTVGTGVLAVTTVVSGWFVLAPAGLLVAVLALGRRAVRANARADAAWTARERARHATRTAADPRLAGRPAPALRTQVTGHAVKSSQVQTQMIARVRPSGAAPSAAKSTVKPADPDASQKATSTDVARVVATVSAPAKAATAPDSDRAATAGRAPGSPVDAGSTDAAADAPIDASADAPADAASAAEWVSVPVPRPVYTMKSAAPRWEPAPLTAEMAQITQARRAELAAGDPTPPAATPTTVELAPAGPEVPSGDRAEAVSDSLGVNLNDVLARRRASGE